MAVKELIYPLVYTANEAGRLEEKNQRKIMIVDDEADIVAVLKLALKEYPAIGFTEPHAAYDALKTNPQDFHMLISDVRMPGMTGFELASAALSISPEIKIVLMTAFDIQPEFFNKILSATKITKFVTKPFDMSLMRSIVKSQFMSNNQDDLSSSPGSQSGGAQ